MPHRPHLAWPAFLSSPLLRVATLLKPPTEQAASPVSVIGGSGEGVDDVEGALEHDGVAEGCCFAVSEMALSMTLACEMDLQAGSMHEQITQGVIHRGHKELWVLILRIWWS